MNKIFQYFKFFLCQIVYVFTSSCYYRVGFSDKKQLLSFGGLPDAKVMATIIEKRVEIYSLDGKKKQTQSVFI